MELMEQYEAQVKKIEESAQKVGDEQQTQEGNIIDMIKDKLKIVHNGLANATAEAAVSTGIDGLKPYDIGILWKKGNTEVIVNALQQRIDEFKRAIEKDKEIMINNQIIITLIVTLIYLTHK